MKEGGWMRRRRGYNSVCTNMTILEEREARRRNAQANDFISANTTLNRAAIPFTFLPQNKTTATTIVTTKAKPHQQQTIVIAVIIK